MAREGVQIYDMDTTATPYIDGVALNVTTTGDSILVGDKRTMRLDMRAIYVASYTAIKITMDHYSDMMGAWCEVHEIASGGASTPFNAEYTVAASKDWSVSVDVAPYKKVRIKVTSTGGGATETMTIWHALILD